MLNICIKKDYYAYISSDNEKLLQLIKKSFTRTEKIYNNFYKMYEKRTKMFYGMVEQGKYIKVKAGIIKYLTASLDKNHIEYNIKDERLTLDNSKIRICTALSDTVTLRPYQFDAVTAVLKNSFSCIQLPTGSGKTEIAASIIKSVLNIYFTESFLYVVPTCRLQKEAETRFKRYNIKTNTELPLKSGYVNILTYAALIRADNNKLDYKQREKVCAIVFDEAHKLSADKTSKIVHRFSGLRLCVGISATLSENFDIYNKKYLKELDSKELFVCGCTGPVVYNMDISDCINNNFITNVEIRVANYKFDNHIISRDETDWYEIKDKILKSDDRADFVAKYIKHIITAANLNTIVLLTPEVEWSRIYMKYVFKNLKDFGFRFFELYGQEKIIEHIGVNEIINIKTDEDKNKVYKAIKDPNIKTIFSATSFFYEGVDIANIQALVNCGSGRSVKRIKQQAGRIMRLFKDKDIAYIHEIKDYPNIVLENQCNRRLSIYEEEYNAKIIYSSFKREE